MSWFSWLIFWKKKSEPEPVPDQRLLMPPVPTPAIELRDVFLEAIQEVHEEVYAKERELLNDTKLRSYIKNFISAVSTDLAKGDHYDFILVHSYQVKIDKDIWSPFSLIMIELLKSIDLPAEKSDDYIKLQKADVRRVFGDLKKQVIDIDERARTMLSQGIYR